MDKKEKQEKLGLISEWLKKKNNTVTENDIETFSIIIGLSKAELKTAITTMKIGYAKEYYQKNKEKILAKKRERFLAKKGELR
jgi:hypothetical protein